MLDRIILQNYEAFPNAFLKIAPITLLIGPNSSGKSSLLHFPLLLQQSASFQGISRDKKKFSRTLECNGDLIQLGDAKSLLYKKDACRHLAFILGFSDCSVLNDAIDSIQSTFVEHVFETVRTFYSLDLSRGLSGQSTDIDRLMLKRLARNPQRIMDPHSRDEALALLDKIRKTMAALEKTDLKADSPERILSQRFDPRFRSLVRRRGIKSTQDYSLCFKMLDALSAYKNHQFAILFTMSYISDRRDYQIHSIYFLIKTCDADSSADYNIANHDNSNMRSSTTPSAFSDELPLAEVEFQKRSSVGYIGLTFTDSAFADIDASFLNNEPTKFAGALKEYVSNCGNLFDMLGSATFSPTSPLFPTFVYDFTHRLYSVFVKSFSPTSFQHIGPLRSAPRQYYPLTDYYQLRLRHQPDGMAYTLFENDTVLAGVNRWLQRFRCKLILDERIQEVFRLKVIPNEEDIDIDITNVGFGISQVLPILSHLYLACEDSIIIIEQPEVHLHPDMQSLLGDLFVEISKSTEHRIRFLIETHSTALINRLRLRVAEQKEISHGDLAIYATSINQQNEGSVNCVRIDRYGGIDWPDGFVDQELEDAIALSQIRLGHSREENTNL